METNIYNDRLLRITGTPSGPRVYLADTRIHHWMPGLLLTGVGLLGLLFDDNKVRRRWYCLSTFFGGLLVLDDLKDFLLFLQNPSESE